MKFHRLNYYKAAPDVAKALLDMENALAASRIEKPLQDLVKIRVSQINGCAFCVNLHTREASKAGESVRRLFALGTWEETTFFNERERAALKWAETLTLVAERRAPEQVYNEVAAHFSEREMVELTFAITTINAWNRFGIGFAAHPE
jgi:AhpD family alkylhydroperoxidase